MQYLHAIKNLNKKYYMTPFLIFIYIGMILILRDPVKRFIEFGNYGVMDIIQFILVLLFSYKLIIISIFFYPHATFFIQTTWLYKKVFGSTWGVVTSGLSKYLNIGKSIPDDYHFRSSSRSYTVSSGYKTKRERVRDMQSTYLIYLFFKFFLKDLTLRMFTHFGVFVISPILFLIAIPILNKKGHLINIEK